MAHIAIDEHDVLMVVDVQNDFCPDGALQVSNGHEVVPLVNRLAHALTHVILTQDWHPRGHHSFASSHPGRQPFETIEVAYGGQVLWPDHCIQGTSGAEFHPDLGIPHAELVLRKGYHRAIDSYSAFYENDRTTPTGLAGFARAWPQARLPDRARIRLLRTLLGRGCAPRRVRRSRDRGS